MNDNPAIGMTYGLLVFVAFCILVAALFTTQESIEEAPPHPTATKHTHTHTVTHTITPTPAIDRAITPAEELK